MESLMNMLIRHEGKVKHAYQDSEGYWTIGVGRLIDQRMGGGLSDDEIHYLLRNDIQRVIKEAKNFAWYDSLDNPRKTVVLNMIFNLGITRFSGFKKMIAAIERGDFKEAASHAMDSKWAKQTGIRAVELAGIMESGY